MVSKVVPRHGGGGDNDRGRDPEERPWKDNAGGAARTDLPPGQACRLDSYLDGRYRVHVYSRVVLSRWRRCGCWGGGGMRCSGDDGRRKGEKGSVERVCGDVNNRARPFWDRQPRPLQRTYELLRIGRRPMWHVTHRMPGCSGVFLPGGCLECVTEE